MKAPPFNGQDIDFSAGGGSTRTRPVCRTIGKAGRFTLPARGRVRVVLQ